MELRTDLPEIGSRVEFTADVERYPIDIWKPGTTGTVTTSEHDYIGVTLDAHDEKLDEWDNQVMWYGSGAGLTQDEMIAEFWSQVREAAPSPSP